MGSLWTIGFIVIMFALMYFTMFKPQKKQQQKKMEMMNELKKGDNVIMIDGLHGKVDSVNSKDKTIVLDADGIYLTFSRMAVQQIIPAAPETEEAAPAKETAAEEKSAAPADKPAQKEPADTPSSENKDDQSSDE
ncbi:preprotein translocase subunit YajC [Lactobacillus panisapium]|nr:preprotein translocase subunit YajC [Lactobacillus panisapium]QYN55597.1 preprotein translocase subunit YajC [Lactobacillus panisapium]